MQRFQLPDGNSISAITISPDQQFALLASWDFNLYLFDLTSREIVNEFKSHNSDVQAVSFSPNGKTAVSSDRTGSIIWWDIEEARILKRFEGHNDDVRQVEFVDYNRFVSISSDQSMRFWDLHSNWEVARWYPEIAGEPAFITALEMYSNGQAVMVVVNDQILLNLNHESGGEITILDSPSVPISSLAILNDGTSALLGLINGDLVRWDIETGSQLEVYRGHRSLIKDIEVSSDDRFVLSSAVDGEIHYRDLESGQILQILPGTLDGRGVVKVDFLNNDQVAVSGSWDSTLVLWDLTTGEQIRRLTGLAGDAGSHLRPDFDRGIVDIAVHPNGVSLLSVGVDQSVLLWDATMGSSKNRYSGLTGYLYEIDVFPDGQRFITTGQDKALLIWDIEQDAPIREFVYEDGKINSLREGNLFLSLHPDGHTAVTADSAENGSIIYWRLTNPTPSELLEWLQENRLIRELTCQERQLYQLEPLCSNGASVETTAELLNLVSASTASLESKDSQVATNSGSINLQAFSSPAIKPKLAVRGENRGELQRNSIDVWSFEAEEDQILTIKMIADTPMDLYRDSLEYAERFESGALDAALYIIGPEGELLVRADDSISPSGEYSTDVDVIAFVVPESGIYRIEARSYLDDHAGGYTLTINDLESYPTDVALLEEYVGNYLEGPWEFNLSFVVEDEELIAYIEQTGEVFRLTQVGVTEFIVEDGSTIVFSRDESGQVDGYDTWISLIHPVGGNWYRADRLED